MPSAEKVIFTNKCGDVDYTWTLEVQVFNDEDEGEEEEGEDNMNQ